MHIAKSKGLAQCDSPGLRWPSWPVQDTAPASLPHSDEAKRLHQGLAPLLRPAAEPERRKCRTGVEHKSCPAVVDRMF